MFDLYTVLICRIFVRRGAAAARSVLHYQGRIEILMLYILQLKCSARIKTFHNVYQIRSV